MKTLMLVRSSIKEYKIYNLVVGLQILFCVFLMSYVMTNAENIRQYEMFYKDVTPDYDWYIYANSPEKRDAKGDYEKICQAFPQKKIGLLATGYSGKQKFLCMNDAMVSYRGSKLKFGNWFTDETQEYYEAIIGESILNRYDLNEIYNFTVCNEELGKKIDISVKIIGVLDKESLVWGLHGNYYEGMLEKNSEDFIINIKDTTNSALMEILTLNGCIVKNEKKIKLTREVEEKIQYNIYSMQELFLEYIDEIKTEKGIAEILLILVLLLTMVGCNSLLLLLSNKKRQKYAVYIQCGATYGRCICMEFINIVILLAGVAVCYGTILLVMNKYIDTNVYFSEKNSIFSFLFCGAIYMLSYCFILWTNMRMNLKDVFLNYET